MVWHHILMQCDNPRCRRCWRIYGGTDECKLTAEEQATSRTYRRFYAKKERELVQAIKHPEPTRAKLVKWVSEIPSKKHPGVIYRLEIQGLKLECRCPVYKRGHICKHVRKQREKLRQLPLF